MHSVVQDRERLSEGTSYAQWDDAIVRSHGKTENHESLAEMTKHGEVLTPLTIKQQNNIKHASNQLYDQQLATAFLYN